MNATRTLVIVTTLMLSACQGAATSSSPIADTSASATTADSVTPISIATTPPTTAAQPVPEPTASTDDGANPFGGHAAEDGLMPSVVCMNLQDAQNEIQDHGVFASSSQDATGQGRSQIIDSNWQVVAQNPDAGMAIGEFDATLFVVKYGEQPNPC